MAAKTEDAAAPVAAQEMSDLVGDGSGQFLVVEQIEQPACDEDLAGRPAICRGLG
jgi:hypothetical protein